jgi:ATP-dependent Clp protease ATP-binding subunit ClpA
VFERFTEHARQVVVLSQEEARVLRHNYIGSEHILLGLLREEEGLAARVLESLAVTVERVRPQVVRIVGSGEEVASGQIPFTPRAKKVLELALREALRVGHNYIGTGHLLLGLVAEGDGVAMCVLKDLGIDGQTLQTALLQAGGWDDGQEPPPSERFLTRDIARRAVLRAAEVAEAAGRRVDSGDLIVALAETDELARGVLSRYVSLDQLAAELEAARKALGD